MWLGCHTKGRILRTNKKPRDRKSSCVCLLLALCHERERQLTTGRAVHAQGWRSSVCIGLG